MASSDRMKPLQDALAVKESKSGDYQAAVHSDYCFGDWALGGFVVSLIQRAAAQYAAAQAKEGSPPADVLNMQIQFLRPVLSEDVGISIRPARRTRSLSTLHIAVTQDGKDCVVGYVNLSDLEYSKGPSFPTLWHLHPSPVPVTPQELESNTSPNWLRYATPYSPEGFYRLHSLVNFHLPLQIPHPSFAEQWITPTDPSTTFTNETLGLIADLWAPFLENHNPESDVRHARLIDIAKQQRENTDGSSELSEELHERRWTSPYVYTTMSMTLHVKRRLPEEGVKWLFVRAEAKTVEKGKFDVEVLILDEGMRLVAVSNHVSVVIDFMAELRDKAGVKDKAKL